MRRILLAVALALATFPAYADDVPSNLALVRKIINLPAMQYMFSAEGMNETMENSIGTLMGASGKTIPQGVMENLRFTPSDAKRLHDMAEMEYLKIFTESELQAMYDFYSTPNGESIAKKMPKLTGAMAPLIAQIQREKMAKVMKQLRNGQ